jgi:hypothetical protein
MRVDEYCCPSCGVVVLSGDAIVPEEDSCVLCAPYDEAREPYSLDLISDALDYSLRGGWSMGAKPAPPPPSRPSNAMFTPDQAKTALEVNAFAKHMLDILYEDAKFGSANQVVRDGGKQILDGVNLLINAKIMDPSQVARTAPVILTKEDTNRYLGILELLHTRYTPAHQAYISTSANVEEARRHSYGMFWHIGSLVRTGQLATSVSPWITGKEKPRF